MESDKQKKHRTLAQNRAMHKLFGDIANEMLSQGIGMQPLLDNIELMVTPQNIKEVWRAVQIQVTGKESTADLTTDECDKVWQNMIPILRKTGIEAEFPSWLAIMENDYYQSKN